jgi:hypothetical protein
MQLLLLPNLAVVCQYSKSEIGILISGLLELIYDDFDRKQTLMNLMHEYRTPADCAGTESTIFARNENLVRNTYQSTTHSGTGMSSTSVRNTYQIFG